MTISGLHRDSSGRKRCVSVDLWTLYQTALKDGSGNLAHSLRGKLWDHLQYGVHSLRRGIRDGESLPVLRGSARGAKC